MLRAIFTPILLGMIFVGCSNPFAKPKPMQTYQSKDLKCSEINFQKETLDPDQIRSMVDCLNSSHQIEPIANLLSALGDQDLTPFTQAFNDVIGSSPRLAYATREYYFHLKRTGRFVEVSRLVATLLADKQQNEIVAGIIRKHSPEFAGGILNARFTVNLESLYKITQTPAYIRFLNENNRPQFWEQLIFSTQDYLTNPHSLTLIQISNLLRQTQADTKFMEVIQQNPEQNLKKAASALDWLFEEQHLAGLSKNLRELQGSQMTCLNQSHEVKNPDVYFAKKIAALSASEAKSFFSSEARTLTLMGQWACDVPDSFKKISQFFSEFSEQPGFEVIYPVISAALKDEKTLKFISSFAVEKWVTQNKSLIQNHFFYDFVSLLYQAFDLKLMTGDGEQVFSSLDYALKNFSKNELLSLIQFAQPLFNSKDGNGNSWIGLLYSETAEFPSLPKPKWTVSKDALRAALSSILRNPHWPKALDQLSKMGENGSLQTLLDDTLKLFSIYFERGKYPLQFVTAPLPAAIQTSPYSLALEKLSIAINSEVIACSKIDLTWEQGRAEELFACLDPNRAHPNTRRFFQVTAKNNLYPKLLDIKEDAIARLSQHSLNAPLALLRDWLTSSPQTIQNTLQLVQNTSALFQTFKETLVRSPSLNKIVSEQLGSSAFYLAIKEVLLHWKDGVTNKTSFDLYSANSVDVQINSHQSYANITYTEALKKLFAQYCPTLDTKNADCDLDDDQVLLFRKDPLELVNKIKKEYLNYRSNWIHPSSFPGWKHVSDAPSRTSDFEQHLYPLLHQAKNNPKAIASIAKFLSYFQLQTNEPISSNRHYSEDRIIQFLKKSANHLTLVPYFYQNDRVALSDEQEHHSRLRVRLVSDLDEIELMGINTDFVFIPEKYPALEKILSGQGIVFGNTGMRLSSEIGFAMGDLPMRAWPPELQRYKKLQRCSEESKIGANDCVRTFQQIKSLMYRQLDLFDTAVLRELGDCDSRDSVKSLLCIPSLFDVRARVFNMGILAHFLDQGDGDIVRDAFYALHTASTKDGFENYPDGLKMHSSCFTNPMKFNARSCNYDNLEIASMLARLGFIHEISLSLLQNDDSPFLALTHALMNLQRRSPAITDEILGFLSTQRGVNSVIEITDGSFKFQDVAKENAKNNLALWSTEFLKISSALENQNWVRVLVSMLNTNPKLFSEHIFWISNTAQVVPASTSPGSYSSLLTSNQGASNRDVWNGVSSNFNDETAKSLTKVLENMRSNEQQVTSAVKNLSALSFQDVSEMMKQNAAQLCDEFSKTPSKPISQKTFSAFCDVYSDGEWIDVTLKSLEEIHTSPRATSMLDDITALLQ